jgi:hypothetical protein
MQMGYSHYWHVEKEVADDAWKKIVTDTRKLITAFGEPVELTVSDEGFLLNADSCESLVLTRKRREFASCKTFHASADKLICAILSVAALASPDIKVESDAEMGSKPDGWPAATRWASKVLGYEVQPPLKTKRPPVWQSILRTLHLG